MKLLIAGSRTINDYHILDEAMKIINVKSSLIISGEAKGVDTLAKKYALNNKINYKGFPVKWSEYGKAAGHIRNSEMIEEADAVLVIWDGKSRGTQDTIKKAKKKNIPLTIIEVTENKKEIKNNFLLDSLK